MKKQEIQGVHCWCPNFDYKYVRTFSEVEATLHCDDFVNAFFGGGGYFVHNCLFGTWVLSDYIGISPERS